MFKSFRMCSTILTVLCSHIMLLDTTSAATLTDNGENLNIINVLNTSEYHWLYWETSKNDYTFGDYGITINETQTCIRILKQSISSTEYYFEQTYVMQDKETSSSRATIADFLGKDHYRGVFNGDTNPPKSMTVYTVDEENERKVKVMTLGYTEDDGTYFCSVFFIFPVNNEITDNFENCEMYVKDSHVKQGPSESCKTFFKTLCGKTIYQPYSDSCNKTFVDISDNNDNNNNDYS
ncbi:uncharacterized protein LOC142564525 [Dermacentor variabilis]|uniref:uncharacterized protein LOC142564525 n=1 Tax=Dermacentor variabilis TaxID=34621 RepID=UPI003F5B4B76